MKRKFEQNNWLWLIRAEDSSIAEDKADLFLTMTHQRKPVMSVAKLLLWYGAALSFAVLISKLH